jgi:hypothetical protein
MNIIKQLPYYQKEYTIRYKLMKRNLYHESKRSS